MKLVFFLNCFDHVRIDLKIARNRLKRKYFQKQKKIQILRNKSSYNYDIRIEFKALCDSVVRVLSGICPIGWLYYIPSDLLLFSYYYLK